MPKGFAALSYLPQTTIAILTGGADHTFEALRAGVNQVARFQEDETADGTYAGVVCRTSDPFTSATWDFVKGAASSTFATGTVTLVSAVANTFATGTVTAVSAVANTYATGTVTCASALAGDTVTVNGLLYTGVAGARSDNTEFSIDTSDAATGIDLNAAVTADVRSGTSGDISAADNGAGVVTFTTDVAGTAGNAITLVSSNGTRLAVTGSGFLTGGVNADTVTVNGLVYTGVAGARADNTQFSIDTSDAAVGIDLNAAVTADVRAGTSGDISAADNGAGVVTFTTDVTGAGGNAITLVSSSGTRLAVTGGGVLSGGVTADSVTVNGLAYTAVAGARADNTQFSIDTSDAAAGIDLHAAVDADVRAGTSGDISAADDGAGVVTFTTDVAEEAGNLITLVSSNGTRLAVTGAGFLTGGVDALAYQMTFNAETSSQITTIGRPALATRRKIDPVLVENGYKFTVRSLLAAINFAQKLEDQVAATGTGSTGDGTYSNVALKGNSPFETFTWTIQKTGNDFVFTPTATS